MSMSSRKRKPVQRLDSDFEYDWHPPEKMEFKEEEYELQYYEPVNSLEQGEVHTEESLDHMNSSSVYEKPKEEEIVGENDFSEAKEEAERPKLTWPQMIDEVLREAEDKRLSSGQICSYIAQSYPYFNKNAERWEKARKVIKGTILKYGYKKVEDKG